MKSNTNKKKLKKHIAVYLAQFAVFAVTLAAMTVIGFIVPLRPQYSESEKRELAKFPQFSVSEFFSGDYFRKIGDWYSDTYPGRETWVGLNTKIKSNYGISSEEIHGEIIEGDEIPDEYVPQNESLTESNTENTANEEPTWESYVAENENTQTLGAVFVAGDRAYEYYNFSQSVANSYIGTINREADTLKDVANFYVMIVPTSIGITLPDNYMATINSSDQKKAMDYMFSGMSENVKQIRIYNTLMEHRKEYIYFNTDHHWTALGAYYAYEQFADASGITKMPLSAYKQVEFDNFLGSFYTDTGKLPVLEKNPDKIIAYVPNENATLVYTTSKGEQFKWPIINDVTAYTSSAKYSTFIAGDNPFTEITNPDINDGSSLLVVKESFGNAVVPFLVENYEKIYVIDYRHYKGSVSDFVKKHGVQDVLYINNVSATRNKSLMEMLDKTV
ncbi:MAG: hypothetical protein J1F23_01820 [Oscillospiraceae bacterium]|nr:hypothetical protein [Oscillospiraceae bacterium]